MGLLDGMMDPESMATLQLAGGLLSPGSFGQGLSRGLTNYQATLTNAQDMAAKKQDMALQAAKLLSLQRNQDIVNGVLSRWNSPQGTDDQSFQFRAGQQALAMNQSAGLPAGPLASGAQPDQMPATTQPTIKQNGFPLSFRDVTALKMVGGPDLLKEWQIGNEGIEQKAGSFYKDPMTGQTRYVPDPTKGINFDPNTGRASVIPGASQAQADLAGATSGATEAAKAKYNFVDAYDPVTQRPIKVRADIVANSPGSSAPSAWIGSQPSNSDPLIGAVIQTESGGNQSAVSPKGAAGRMQLMPTTAHGLGVNASDPLENVAGGVSYLNQLRKKYGDDRTALVAYNWGPGNTDLWLKSGGDPAKLPPETRNYVSTVMQRAGTSTPPQTSMPAGALPAGPSADDAAGQAANKQFRVDLLTKAHASNADVLSKLQDTVRNEAELMNRNAQLVPLLDKFQTGGFSPESRIAFANSLQTSNLIPDSLKTKLATWVANGDPTTGKVIENQLAAAGIKTMLDTLDKEGKPNRAIFDAVRAAQESVQSGNATLRQVFALQKQLYDWHYQQEQDMSGKMAAPDYNPLTMQREFSQSRNASLAPPKSAPSAAPTDFRAAVAAELAKRKTLQPRSGGATGSY